MLSCCLMEYVKVAIVYRGRGKRNEDLTTKVWWLDPNAIHLYTSDMVEQQLLQYFPSIQQKGYGVSLYYKDSFVGEVKVDSDEDLQVGYTGCILHELYTVYCRVAGAIW